MAERVEAVRRAAERWKQQLVDVSGRNPLRNYRDLKLGTLDLTPGPDSTLDPRILNLLLAGRQVSLSRLFTYDWSQDDARKRLSVIHRKAQEVLEEKGILTLSAAAGLATWSVEKDSRPNAPVILLPLTVKPKSIARWDFEIKLSDDAQLNPVLDRMLRIEHGIDPAKEIHALADDPPRSFAELKKWLSEATNRWTKVRGLRIEPRIVVRDFHYTNMAMVDDLEQNYEALAANDLVAAIAGVEDARQSVNIKIQDLSPGQPDNDPPQSEYLILDADSTQHRAINRALAGESLVIWGPPGTGKSQTIANLIAASIARGKRVLFVAQKRAAVEVVVDRLRRVDLSDLVLDAHGGAKSKREFARRMDDAIRKIRSVPLQNYSGIHLQLKERRGELIAHLKATHQRRAPWNVSAFEVQRDLIDTLGPARTNIRLPYEKAQALDQEAVEHLKVKVDEWVSLEGHSLATRYPEWARSTITTSSGARAALELVRDLAHQHLPKARSILFDALDEVGLDHPKNVVCWRELVCLMISVEQLLGRFRPEIYDSLWTRPWENLAPAQRWWSRVLAGAFDRGYRATKESVRAMLRSSANLSGTDALHAVNEADRHKREWDKRSVDDGAPRVPANLERVRTAVDSMVESFEALRALRVLTDDLLAHSDSDLANTLNSLESQQSVVASLPRVRELNLRFKEAGLDRIIAAVGAEVPPEHAADAVEYAWLQPVSDDMTFGDRDLANFKAAAHDRRREDFTKLDQQHLATNPSRIRRSAAETATRMMNEHPTEDSLLRREAKKRRRNLPIRQLIKQAPHVLTAVFPCWTMSPLEVTELIPADADLFDLVIFDEASQIPPAEAIGSLARAPQAVIAGDDRQLPPTDFFRKRALDDEIYDEDDSLDAASIEDIESILDVAKAIPIQEEMLRWHYRSRDDRLIAFSNAHLYDKDLTTFPGTASEDPIIHHLVSCRPLPRQSTRSHPDEVKRVVDLIIDHARRYPAESLGVIAFGIHHANKIYESLHARLQDISERQLEEFFSEDADERFFVKNIERVQGDERDVIILSVGYHKAADGSLPYRFGPLNQEGGERRLNVAITRARCRMHLVSSFSHRDMDPERTSARGVKLLRDYLEFAASGSAEPKTQPNTEETTPFDRDVVTRLRDRGIRVTPQYGKSKDRIEFVCAHPREPRRMVLAVESDGAGYRSAPTTRDRDRLRQQVLEDLGWQFHRIWSVAWSRDRDEEVDRTVAAWKKAVQLADSPQLGALERRLNQRKNAGFNQSRPADLDSATPSSHRQGPRPDIPTGLRIAEYAQDDLVSLARWISSDTLLRTDDDLLEEMMRELGFRRHGPRIDEALRSAIAEVRHT